MGNLRSFRYALLAGFTLSVLIHAQVQDQSGFISIDCGLEGSGYTDKTTGISYVSDENFTDTGIGGSISSEFKTGTLEKQFYNVRSFPESEGKRNCYTLNPSAESKDDRYLIRARFMYGNYDGLNAVPQFDIHLGVNIWDTIELYNASNTKTTEIIVPAADFIYVCLVYTGSGTPFISSLELRILKRSIYKPQNLTESLVLYGRYDLGSASDQTVRYKDDIYDRIWMPQNLLKLEILSTPLNLEILSTPLSIDPNNFQPAPVVMSTAVTPENVTEDLSFLVGYNTDPTSQYYIYLHFAEVVDLDVNQTREFDIYLNNTRFLDDPLTPEYLGTNTVYSDKRPFTGAMNIRILQTERSNLPPIINAIEIYIVKEFSQSQTFQNDVDAIMLIKSAYRVKRNWQGDPCAPEAYSWDGLACSYEDNNPPRIISLNLSSSGLTGEIAPFIADLKLLQYLDLSNNDLVGAVPDFLSGLPSLKILKLERNNFSGSLPPGLVERSKNGSLTLSMDEINQNIPPSTSNKERKNEVVVPIVASVAASFALVIALAIFCSLKTRKKHAGKMETELENKNGLFASKNQQFSYSEVRRITNNFEWVLGKGGFGTVYHGYLDDTEVAVKMLSPSSAQGYKEFQAEVKLLVRVHHRNLIALVGYCMEGANMGLIYEYLANGTLDQHLSGRSEYTLGWEDRLRIAVDAAQGLEYLHNGCKPPIVHRDVKPSNILLNEKLQAKIGDFGLSRIFPIETDTSIWTDVAGTPGYLDPLCSLSNSLNEKSDVYSFGVVLLKIITNRPVIAKISLENVHISEWVKRKLAEGDIRKIVDRSLGDNFHANSAWKAVELALACASHTSSGRPTMTEVVTGLKECFAVEIAQTDEGHGKSDGVNLDTEFSPLAR